MREILGQSRALENLHSALVGQRLHHALIFHGPAGVGKFTTAVAFARRILCHDPQRDLTGLIEPCGACPACKSFDQGGHPDLHIVTKELARYSDDPAIRKQKLMNIPLDVLTVHVLEPAYQLPRLEHNKIFIIDEAELINPLGQNVLLKTLEEPPAGTYIILVTSNEDKLLPTVRSRCHRVTFTALPEQFVADWLKKQEAALDQRTGQWVIDFADGSLGMAKLALDHDLAAWGRVIESALDDLARGRYPVDLGAQLKEMIDGFAVKWVEDHENASKEAANKHSAALAWRIISHFVRRKIASLAAAADPADPIAAEAKLLPWINVIEALDIAEAELNANVNMGLVTDHLVSMMDRAMKGERVAVQ